MVRIFGYSILALVLLSSTATAAVLTVDHAGGGDYTTISGALEAAEPAGGDVIEIFPGTYAELVAVDRSVELRGIGVSGSVIIDGEDARGGMTIHGAYVVDVSGLTFTNGYVTDTGGAIDMRNGPIVNIDDCQFIGNRSTFDHGALSCRHVGTRVTVTNCEFIDNYASHNAGAVGVLVDGTIELLDCRFIENSSAGLSGAVASDTRAYLTVEGCLFLRNEGSIGAILIRNSTGIIRDNTLHANLGGLGSIDCASAGGVVERNIITGNTRGPGLMVEHSPFFHSCNVFYDSLWPVLGTALASDEVEADPLYCDLAADDLTVGLVSPASPAYSSCGQPIGALPVICPLPVRAEEGSISRLKALF